MALTKTAVKEIVTTNPEISNSFANRYRSNTDYSLWIVRYFLMLSGQFIPRTINFGKRFSLNQNELIRNAFEQKKYKMVCINDVAFESKDKYIESVDNALNVLNKDMPIKSSFEK